jgi:hypothetical protein
MLTELGMSIREWAEHDVIQQQTMRAAHAERRKREQREQQQHT